MVRLIFPVTYLRQLHSTTHWTHCRCMPAMHGAYDNVALACRIPECTQLSAGVLESREEQLHMLQRWLMHMARGRAWSQQLGQMLTWQSSEAMSCMWCPPTALSPSSTRTLGGVRTAALQTSAFISAKAATELSLPIHLPQLRADTDPCGLWTAVQRKLVCVRTPSDRQHKGAPSQRTIGPEEGVKLQATRGS